MATKKFTQMSKAERQRVARERSRRISAGNIAGKGPFAGQTVRLTARQAAALADLEKIKERKRQERAAKKAGAMSGKK